MKYCPNCNKELDDSTMFCDNCGAQVPAVEAAPVAETVFCPQCGQQTDASAPYCQSCGAVIGEAAPAPKAKKGPAKALIIGGIAIVAIAAIVIAALLIFGGGRNSKYVAYLKDAELFFNDYSGESLQVTDKLFDASGFEKLAALQYSDDVGNAIRMSADGKTMFFPDKIEDMSGYTLYCRDVTKEDSEAIKISSDVTAYTINKKGDKIAYLKDDTLYVGGIEDAEKVSGEVTSFYISEDFKTVIYRQTEEVTVKEEEGQTVRNEYTYYLWEGDDKVKIASGVTGGFAIADDDKLDTVCYKKDDVLYVQDVGDEEAVKIDSDVVTVYTFRESGDLYYTKKGEELKYVDYVNNDNETEYSDEQKKATLPASFYESLYVYDGKESTLIADNVYYPSFAADSDVAIVRTYNVKKADKVKLSENSWGYEYAVENNLRDTLSYSVMAENALTEIDLDDIYDYSISKDGSEIYFLTIGTEKEKDENGEVTGEVRKDSGDLYKVTVKKATVNAPEEYDTDVSAYGFQGLFPVGEEKLVYYKNYKSEKNKADLWVDGEEIDSDAVPGEVFVLKDGSVLYMTDYNSEKDYGTLKISKKGEATVVAEDVHDYLPTPDGEVLYLTEYNVEKGRGELYRYNKGKNEMIDEDVMAILNIYVWEED